MIVKYSKKFPYAPYLNEDIGFEEDVEGLNSFQVGSVLGVLERLKAIAEQFHKDNNPQLEEVPNLGTNGEPFAHIFTPHPPLPTVDYKAKDRLLKLIVESKTKDELSKFKDDAMKHDLGDEYDAKLNLLK